MRILVVEDERILCDGIAEDLELEKYTADRCYDGEDAYERLSVEHYDLVILDLNPARYGRAGAAPAHSNGAAGAAGADPVCPGTDA